MTIDEIVTAYCNYDDGEHTRKVGRYYSSEISSIKKGYLTPKKFFEKKQFDILAAKRISSGRILETGFEEMLTTLKIPHIYNPKHEIKIDDFVIICKPDFVMKDFVIETKFPGTERSWDYLMDSYKYQLQAEHEVTQLPVYLGRFVMENGNEFTIKFRKHISSDELWKEAVEIVRNFHKKLTKYTMEQK